MSTTSSHGMRHIITRLIHCFRYGVHWLDKITRTDLRFMGALWSSSVIDPWVQFWASESHQNSLLQRSGGRKVFFLNFIILLGVKTLSTILVSIAVDLGNHKFLTYLISLFVYIVGPIIGLVGAILQSFVISFFPLWFTASLFVTYPTKFCLIFNQRPGALISETREVVALFEMIVSLSGLVLYIWIFFNGRVFSQGVNIALWVIFIALFAGVIGLTIFVRKYKTEEVIKESEDLRRSKESSIARLQNPTTVNNKIITTPRFIMFASLLCPGLVITSVDVTLTIINNFTSRNVPGESPKKVFKFLTKFVAIPAIGLLFSGAKGFVGNLGDHLVIAGAHTFNTIVILLIYLYLRRTNIIIDTNYNKTTIIDELNVTFGYFPNSKQAVIGIISGMSFAVRSSAYNSSVTSQFEQFYVNVTNPPISLTVGCLPSMSAASVDYSLTDIEPGKRYWYLLLGRNTELRQLLRASGSDEYWTGNGSKINLYNGLYSLPVLEKFKIINLDTKWNASYDLPPLGEPLGIILQEGRHGFYYGDIDVHLYMVPSAEYIVHVSNINPIKTIVIKPTLLARMKERTNTTDDELLQASNALSGLTQAAATIGYLHFFWMESPKRMRTTVLACFMVTNELVAKLTEALLVTFSKEDALIYLYISCFAGVFHISLALFYDLHYNHFIQPLIKTAPEKTPEPGPKIAPSVSVMKPPEDPFEPKRRRTTIK